MDKRDFDELELSKLSEGELLTLDKSLTRALKNLDEALEIFDGKSTDDVPDEWFDEFFSTRKDIHARLTEVLDECQARRIDEEELETY